VGGGGSRQGGWQPQALYAGMDAKGHCLVGIISTSRTSVCVGLLLQSLLRLRRYVAGEYVLNCALGGPNSRAADRSLLPS